MPVEFFVNLYSTLQVPVIVCRNDDAMTVVYANASALILLNPSMSTQQQQGAEQVALGRLMRFSSNGIQASILQTLRSVGTMDRYRTSFVNSNGETVYIQVVANTVERSDSAYFVLYIQTVEQDEEAVSEERESVLFSILHTSHHATNIDEAVESIIAIAGRYVNVSRVYIFEDLHNNYTRNTYEWCAPGIEPAIDGLQNLSKDDYNYDLIVGTAGLYVTDDVRKLPEGSGKEILEAQGIKAIALMPLFHLDTPLGYIGYDDCNDYRIWSAQELQFLQSITSIVSTLIARRNAENAAERGRAILQTITDSTNSVIYVNDSDTYEIKFINRTLANTLKKAPEELIGKICWQVLQQDMKGPCPFCPMPYLTDPSGKPIEETYEWELQNTITGAWFWAKDAIIPWSDGTLAHIETAIDITFRKDYEEQLHSVASIDSLTGVYNREWGYSLLNETLNTAHVSSEPYSLCFIDLDGLKYVNDTYGHQAGDRMILDIVNAIKDGAGPRATLCRWGGDEFILVLRGDGQAAAEAQLREIQEKLTVRSKELAYEHPLAFSFGVVEFASEPSVDALVTKADHIMYGNKMSKRAGRRNGI